MIESTYVAHADFVTEQIVEVDIDPSRGIDGNIDVFVTDRISGDDGSDHGRTAATAVDVNSHAARGSRIFFICKIAGDEVVEDLVVRHVICGQSESRTHMGVQCHAAKPIVRQSVSDDYISGNASLRHR